MRKYLLIIILLLIGCLAYLVSVKATIKIPTSVKPIETIILGGSGDNIYSGVGDGYVKKTDIESWADTHNASIGTADYTNNITTVAGYIIAFTGNSYIYRTFLPFDTSIIPTSAEIVSATLSLYATQVTSGGENLGYDYIGVIQTSQASSTILTTADYNEVGATTTPTLGATSIDIVNITALAYNTFTLNATGLTWIKKSGETSNCGIVTGMTCLGLREGHDIENITPTVTILGNFVSFSTFEDTSGTQYPYLTVTYTIPNPQYPDVKIYNTVQIKSNNLQIK